MAAETVAQLITAIKDAESFFEDPGIEPGRSYTISVSTKITDAMLVEAEGTLRGSRFAHKREDEGGGILRVGGTVWLLKR